MFDAATYVARRKELTERVGSGLVVLLGHDECPMNYADNVYPFRQDSTFLYYVGLDDPGLAVTLDLDSGAQVLYGDDPDPDAVVWTGPQPSLHNRAQQTGMKEVAGSDALQATVQKALRAGRPVRFVPPYRARTLLRLADLLGAEPAQVASRACPRLIGAVVAQRSIKSTEEITHIEQAVEITARMQTAAMQQARPGRVEREIAGHIEGIALACGGRLAFPTIFSVRGEVLHNPFYGNTLGPGQMAVHDCGAESPEHYAGDITRTIPIGGRFDPRQRDVYTLVLETQQAALAAVRPGVEFRAIHRLACEHLAEGLKAMGLMKGDTQEAVAAGAHALFMPCGLGHMLGLDVHDMEALGEDYVGYTDAIRRSGQFGLRSLRLARALEPGFVITVEPGVYFIPALIDRWRAEGRWTDFIHYDRLESWRDFGGIRIEDDVLVTETGGRLLGPPIPKALSDVEALASG